MKCEVCGKEFDNARALRMHKLKVHTEISKKVADLPLGEPERAYLEGLEREVAYWEKRAELEGKLRRAREKLMEPSLVERLEVLERAVAELFRRLKRVEREVLDRIDQEYHDKFLSEFLKFISKE